MKPVASLSLMSALVVGLCAVGFEAEAARKKKPAARSKKSEAVPMASAEEVDKLKGAFKWNMTVDQVVKEVENRVRATYDAQLKETANDPTRQDQIRKRLRNELKDVKTRYATFEGKTDGKTSGYDVSIIDQEFAHKTGESMLVAKEDTSTRYFFFADDKLYKMFIAFDKQILQDKSFEEFGELMQGRFGKAKRMDVDVTRKGETTKKLDHFLWTSTSGDGLRLVDRSEFYDVYCLVVFDGAVAKRLDEARKIAHPKKDDKNALVEAVLNTSRTDADANADIIDRLTGKAPAQVGTAPADVVVPSRSGVAPSPGEVNAGSSKPSGGGSSKPAGKPGKADGLEL
jgi:hypothetical protein